MPDQDDERQRDESVHEGPARVLPPPQKQPKLTLGEDLRGLHYIARGARSCSHSADVELGPNPEQRPLVLLRPEGLDDKPRDQDQRCPQRRTQRRQPPERMQR